MKTIIGILTFMFVFSIGVYAQDRSEIKVSDLPSSITQNLSEQHDGWQAVKAFKINSMDGVSYEVIVKNDNEKMRFTYDERGRLLNKEPYKSEKSHNQNDQKEPNKGTSKDK